jgi:hypothetical protein
LFLHALLVARRVTPLAIALRRTEGYFNIAGPQQYS